MARDKLLDMESRIVKLEKEMKELGDDVTNLYDDMRDNAGRVYELEQNKGEVILKKRTPESQIAYLSQKCFEFQSKYLIARKALIKIEQIYQDVKFVNGALAIDMHSIARTAIEDITSCPKPDDTPKAHKVLPPDSW